MFSVKAVDATDPDVFVASGRPASLGVNRVVMLPPFYYKGFSDGGLFAAYKRRIRFHMPSDGRRDVFVHITAVHVAGLQG